MVCFALYYVLGFICVIWRKRTNINKSYTEIRPKHTT